MRIRRIARKAKARQREEERLLRHKSSAWIIKFVVHILVNPPFWAPLLGPLLPLALRLEQSLGGLRSGTLSFRPTAPDSLHTIEATDPYTGRRLEFLEAPDENGLALRRPGPLGQTSFVFRRSGEALELQRIQLVQVVDGQRYPVTEITLNPPLPDMRYDGQAAEGRFVLSLGGRPGYAWGYWQLAQSEPGVYQLEFWSDGPSWACARPVRSEVRRAGPGAEITTLVFDWADPERIAACGAP